MGDRRAIPSLYQINTRVWLTELSRALGRPATLDDIPDDELDDFAAMGFDWVWLLSVWQTGPPGSASRGPTRVAAGVRGDAARTCARRTSPAPGSRSPATRCDPALGGDAALARLRERLRERGLRLMLDFVPNHTALDHPWVEDHPEYYVAGTELDLERAPRNYTWVKRPARRPPPGPRPRSVLPRLARHAAARLREPGHAGGMTGELLAIAARCDGVRCDMAMLVLPDVFERTWGRRAATLLARRHRAGPASSPRASPSWPRSTGTSSGRCMQQGFDYAYDKRLYDRLRDGHARPVREHLPAGLDYQDEARPVPREPRRAAGRRDVPARRARGGRRSSRSCRPACASSTRASSRAAGSASRRTWSARPTSRVDERAAAFYDALLAVLREPACATATGGCSIARRPGTATGPGTASSPGRGDGGDGERFLVAVNLGPTAGQCYVRSPVDGIAGETVRLVDRMSATTYERDVADLAARGLYLDLPASGYNVFEVVTAPVQAPVERPPSAPPRRTRAAKRADPAVA